MHESHDSHEKHESQEVHESHETHERHESHEDHESHENHESREHMLRQLCFGCFFLSQASATLPDLSVVAMSCAKGAGQWREGGEKEGKGGEE